MEQLKTYITGFVEKNMIPLGVVAIFAVLVLIGFGFIAPLQKAREWAKEHVLWLVVGAAILYTAAQVATDIAASFGF